MNKRIKEIAEKAGIAVCGDTAYAYDPKACIDATVLHNFANMIIQECINQARQEKNSAEAIKAEPDVADQLVMKSENDGIKYAVVRIQLYFGLNYERKN